MKKILFIVLLFLASCTKDQQDTGIEYCCDCMEYYSGWWADPAFCGTSKEVDAFMKKLYSSQVSGQVDYNCTKYINDK